MNYLVLLSGISGWAWWLWCTLRRKTQTKAVGTRATPAATPAGGADAHIEETEEKPTGIRDNLPGNIYQVKLLMLFILRGLRHGLTFSLGSEVSEADKFDDLVFSCYKTRLADQNKEYRLLQAKHRRNETKKIRVIDLLQDKDFGIPKYFTSYRKIKGNSKFSGKLRDFTICTNIDVDAKVFNSVSEIHTGSSQDIILSHKKEYRCKLYKINNGSDVYKKLLPLLKKDHPNVLDAEINEFFDKLVLAVNQPNETELGNIISDEISKQMNLVDGKLLTSRFLESMLDWMNEKMAKFLHPDDINAIFQSLEQNFARTGLIGLSLCYKFKFTKQFLFKDDGQVITVIENFFTDEKKQILTVFYKFKQLSIMKIVQSRGHSKLDEDLFCDFESLQQLVATGVSPIEAFRSEAYNHLVIVVDDDTTLDKTEPILRSFLESLNIAATNSKLKKRVVLVISQKHKYNAYKVLHKLLKELSVNNDKCIAIDDNNNNLSDLTDESEKRLLNEKKINFQGRDIILRSIIGYNKELLNSDTLYKLITDERIVLGSLDTNKTYKQTKDHFVDRTLQRRINVCDSIFDGGDFIITNGSEIDETKLKEGEDIVLISDDENEFMRLCSGPSTTNIHWLKKEKPNYEQSNLAEQPDCIIETDVLLWQRTKGEILKLRKHITNVNMKDKYKPHDVMSSNENTVIIAAEPGMGKSTLLTDLAINSHAESKFELQWIVKIMLKEKDFTEWIYSREIISKNESIQLLYKLLFDSEDKEQDISDIVSVSPDGEAYIQTDNVADSQLNSFEVKLFTHFFNHEKIILYFDGFDEISTEFKRVFLDFMKRIDETKVKKLWVTTGHNNYTNILENKLGTFAYGMVPLNKNEQTHMFNKLWGKQLLKPQINKDRCGIFVNEISSLISQHQPNLSAFIGIPSNIVLFARRYNKVFKEFCTSGDMTMISEIKQKFSIDGLYGEFINTELHNTNMEDEQRTDDIKDKLSLEDYQYLALFELFTENELKQLLSPEKLHSIRELIVSIENSKGNTALIDRIIKGRPHFAQRKIAEHLAADLLARMLIAEDGSVNITEQTFLYDMLTTNDSKALGVFKFLNSKIVRDSTLAVDVNGDCRMFTETDNNDTNVDPLGRTPLHLAAYSCEFNQCKTIFLTKNETHLFQDRLFGWTPLHYIVIREDLLNTDCLNHIPWNAAVNIQDIYGRTPLMIAIQKGYDESVCNLINYLNTNVNLADGQGRTALHYAVSYNDKIITKLIDSGADCFREDHEGNTPLHLVFKRDYPKLVNILDNIFTKTPYSVLVTELKKYGSSIMTTVDNNLKVKLLSNGPLMINFILKHFNLDVNTKNSEGRTGSHCIARCQDIDDLTVASISILSLYNANFNAQDDFGNTPLHYAVERNHTEIIKMLLLGGAYYDCVNIKDLPSNHMLKSIEKVFTSVKQNDTQKFESIIDDCDCYDIVVNAKSKDLGSTPLDYALQHGNKDIADGLRFHGAIKYSMKHENVKADVKLFVFLKDGSIGEVRKSIIEGANINSVDYRSGLPAIHLAVAHGHIGFAEFLIAEGADIWARAADGGTILHTAASKSVEVLKRGLTILEPSARDDMLQSIDAYSETILHRAVRTDDFGTVFAIRNSCPEAVRSFGGADRARSITYNESMALTLAVSPSAARLAQGALLTTNQ